jgi:anti-sigma-K factor RskA
MPLSEEEKAELVAYLDGELDDATTQAIETKIATDPDARAEIDALKQAWGMLDYLPKASPSPSFTNRTMERLTIEKVGGATKTQPLGRSRSPWLLTASWAAALLLAVGGGYLATTHLWPTPPTPDPIPDADQELVRHLRIAEKWRYYENMDDLHFVEKLNHPQMFGEDPS